MIRHSLGRLARMDAAEIGWRLKTHGRAGLDRVAVGINTPAWKRERLGSALARIPGLLAARTALARRDWHAAHGELSRYFAHAPQRFVAGCATRRPLSDAVLAAFPHSAQHAAGRANRILSGEYDLLGYRGLRFGARADGAAPAGAAVDWHFDPVHQRRAPQVVWSAVPYLEPSSGDHKIIWEINRHQHWLTLGRAYWLTGETTYRDRFMEELTGWMAANPPLVGINWVSMLELALRSISWLWAMAFFVEDPADAAGAGRANDRSPWTVDLLLALDRQLTHVEHHLSHYFSPNTHLLGEALALYVSGLVLPELAASGRRIELGRRVLLTQIDRQIASDGGHRERSTHYHRYTLDFYLLALAIGRINGDRAALELERAVSRLASAARLLADDRGRMPHIGDDDGGLLMPMIGRSPDDVRDSFAVASVLLDQPDLRIAGIPEDAMWRLGHDPGNRTSLPRRTATASAALEETGYYVSRTAASDHLVIDGGPHGYQNGGHAHADALSVTFSVRGVPLLIDPGTACYTTDPVLRDRFRSTALHNTLTVDDRPQSIASGPFNWSHTANGHVQRWRTNEAFDYFDGTHDGYRPLTHRRAVLALHDDLLIVVDVVEGPGTHTAAAHWHIDPRWTTRACGRRATFTHRGKRATLIVPEDAIEPFTADLHTGLGWHSPVYGRVEPTTALRITRRATTPFPMASVFEFRDENPVADVEWVAVCSEAGTLGHAVALRISRAASTDYLLIAEPRVASTGELARRTWRIGDVETDARMLFYSATPECSITRLALVDGSIVRTSGHDGAHVDLHDIAPHYFEDFRAKDQARTKDQGRTRDQGRTKNQEPGTKDQACAASPVS